MKTDMLVPERPQTSKGVRSFRGETSEVHERQASESGEECGLKIKVREKGRVVQSSYSSRGARQKAANMETGLDPEFLNLFAS